MVYKSEAKALQKTFNLWVKKYGVVSTVSADSFTGFDGDPKLLWREYEGEDGAFFITPGDVIYKSNNIPCVGYYISTAPWSKDSGNAHIVSGLEVECSNCEGEGEDGDGDECESCEGEGATFVTFPISGGKWEAF
jgi:hypothetical protein